jgi:molybdenum cofactor cytidylyltransferase
MVVLGASAELCRREIHDLPVSSVINHDWEAGMGSSLSLGLETLLSAASPPLDAVIMMLCDQPFLTASILDRLVGAYAVNPGRIVASEYGEVVGVPALFDSALFPDLLNLSGAQGARQILQQHHRHIHKIDFPEGAIDIDTVADYERLNPMPFK